MNQLATQNTGSAVAVPGKSFFESYAESAAPTQIVGDLLKFTKGHYYAGRDENEVKAGTKMVADMDGAMVGWMCWQGGKPTDVRMGRLSEGFQPCRRNELGDDDKSRWETDPNNGEPRDPWQFTNAVVLNDAAGDDLYTFTTSSKGGIGAFAALCKTYGQNMRAKPDQYPVIALGVDSYKHPNKAYGKIFTPKFEVVGWAPKFSAEAPEGADDDDTVRAAPAEQLTSGQKKKAADHSKTEF